MEKQELLASINNTAAQLLRHLVKSTELITGGLETPGKPANRDPGARIGELCQVFLDISHKLQSPDIIVPESIHYHKTDILNEWRNGFDSFNVAAAKADPAALVEDLPFGPITKIEMLNFVDVHLQRHLIQMKKIAAALPALSVNTHF